MNLLYPRRCPVCGEIVMPKGYLACPECMQKLSWVRQPCCHKCGKELSNETAEYCLDCRKRQRSFEHGAALLNYDDCSRDSMAKIKYKNRREYLDFYSQAMTIRLGSKILRMNGDALVPVPIHPTRLRQRGFNQAEVLAKGLSAGLGIPVNTAILERSKKTAPQKSLDPGQRLANLEQAFKAGVIPESIRSVILVDDIYTTGSTIEACTRVLKRAGVERVYYVSICIGHGQ